MEGDMLRRFPGARTLLQLKVDAGFRGMGYRRMGEKAAFFRGANWNKRGCGGV